MTRNQALSRLINKLSEKVGGVFDKVGNLIVKDRSSYLSEVSQLITKRLKAMPRNITCDNRVPGTIYCKKLKKLALYGICEQCDHHPLSPFYALVN